ncbi:MAG: membrane dipeptidase [Planctomycetota bacterium]
MSADGWIDGHLDLAMLAIDVGRDLTLGVEALREREPPEGLTESNGEKFGRAAVTIPELVGADCRLAVCSIFARHRPKGSPERYEAIDGDTPAAAAEQGWAQVRWYHAQAEAGRMSLVTTAGGLQSALGSPTAGGPLPVMLMIEGLDPVLGPDDVPRWHEAGVRMASLVHSGANGLAYGNKTDEAAGLTAAGRAMLRAIDEAGWVLDLSHLNRQGVEDALAAYDGPVVASHSNARAINDTDRHLDDAVLCEIGRRGGVVGLVPYAPFVDQRARGKSKAEHGVGWDAWADHADRVRAVAGAGAPAIGSDLDGGFGADELIDGLDRASGLPELAEVLASRGWPDADRRGLLRDNWARVLTGALS